MSKKLIKEYSVDKGKIVNLDILDVYWGGRFNEAWWEFAALCGKIEEEKQKIRGRPDIKHKWDLERVLVERRLEQYIKTPPSNCN